MEFVVGVEELMWFDFEKNDLTRESVKLSKRSSWLLRVSSKTFWHIESNHEQVRWNIIKLIPRAINITFWKKFNQSLWDYVRSIS